MAVAKSFICRRTPQELTAIVADMVEVEPPTLQDIIDQLDANMARQFQRMLDSQRD
ncbi:hypothetical protein ASR47_100524 [Janthinobacterium psychrotolerans]|uniref:Uncharacterized protein n=2 Tax=Janthinobacterium psychrotolerans TaxID=1747903 RepID=A0A1A7BWV3_9BURK|nr:hypothetical protein ASR47_100524 [Janthinobacterium psychrotolerans]